MSTSSPTSTLKCSVREHRCPSAHQHIRYCPPSAVTTPVPHDTDAPLDDDLKEDARVPRGPGPLRAQRVEAHEAAPVTRFVDGRLRRPAADALERATSRLNLAPGPFALHCGPEIRGVRREIGVGRKHALEVRGRARFAREYSVRNGAGREEDPGAGAVAARHRVRERRDAAAVRRLDRPLGAQQQT